MIGRLKGIIDYIEDDHVILDVNGVGYRVFASRACLLNLRIGKTNQFEIETLVRDDYIHLIGFSTVKERSCYRMLCSVQGVGARMALAFLSHLEIDQLVFAIVADDAKALKVVSGVGPKLAQRVINELQNKITTLASDHTSFSQEANISQSLNEIDIKSDTLQADAISALENLGYDRSNAFRVVTKIIQENPKSDISNLIRLALSELSSNIAKKS